MLKIIRSTDPIVIDHPVFAIYGQPGIGKTSLACSTERPLLLDFDAGAHRAIHRQDALVITAWADVVALMHSPELAAYQTIVVDTVGRCLDVLTADIIRESPKLGPNGQLSQQGWGVLKTRFRQWLASLRALGKDVFLVAHDREDRDGETRIVRPDIAGGSLGEILKVADFIGYVQMAGKKRVLDFSPTDRSIGKNPGNWAPFDLPVPEKAGAFMADIVAAGRAALGQISQASATVTQQVDTWRTSIAALATADAVNTVIPQVKTLPPMVAAPVAKLLMERAKALGLLWRGNKETGQYVEPAAKTA